MKHNTDCDLHALHSKRKEERTCWYQGPCGSVDTSIFQAAPGWIASVVSNADLSLTSQNMVAPVCWL